MRNGTVLKSRASIQNGFSLLEIVMVMAIMSVILVATVSTRESARDALAEHKRDQAGEMTSDFGSTPKTPSTKTPPAPLSRNISNQDIF